MTSSTAMISQRLSAVVTFPGGSLRLRQSRKAASAAPIIRAEASRGSTPCRRRRVGAEGGGCTAAVEEEK